MRIFQTSDYELITKLNKSVHQLHAQLYPQFFKPYNYQTMLPFFQGVMQNPNNIFLLLEDNHQPLGYVWGEIIDFHENDFGYSYRSLYIHQISLEPSARKKGYGSRLMDSIFHYAKQNGVKRVELDFWSKNTQAKKFYKKLGFNKMKEFVYKDI